ncbi:hypothetical protein N7481_006224 [Penicillium waksmanii]|uniref:uncharacterized protein n=1 Tax=Penicillium waksmanii TaxID=69791 RepID=UPI002546EC22|nr:uncharacterized protein N7481_006224 [Penicillium waksmanii]KAJ5984125.1 hypothetical protein N7481_006224 [Penicillium waksmanii]
MATMHRIGLGVEDQPPPLMRFAPRLKGAENWSHWNECLSVVLESVDPKLLQLLTGEYEKPVPTITTPATATTPAVLAQPGPADVNAWHDYSRKLIPYLYATTVAKHHEGHIHAAADAFSAYQSLKNKIGSSKSQASFTTKS